MSDSPRRILLVDPSDAERDALADRLRAQGFTVETARDGAAGAEIALASPPSTVIADLWMPGISGVQLCRLLRAEAATADVPLVLRAESDDPRSRFWAERAGAVALVSKGRMGELARVLRKTVSAAPAEGAFFLQLSGGSIDVRDRIAQHLDAALFESVIAAELRALAGACSFDGLFDTLSQLLAQLMSYRWLAVVTCTPTRAAVHCHPRSFAAVDGEVRAAFDLAPGVVLGSVRDEDAREVVPTEEADVVVKEIPFGGVRVARIAVARSPDADDVDALLSLVARELGGAIRLAMLIEDSQRLATTDPLTGLMNRRAFVEAVEREIRRCDRTAAPMSTLLIDIDHFKSINDRFGHATGDAVLSALGELLPGQARAYDIAARWGGEEFVVALPNTGEADAERVAERVRRAIESATIVGPSGEVIPVTASLGVATRRFDEPLDAVLDRADCAMYGAKTAGRNRVVVASGGPSLLPDSAPASSVRAS